MATFKALVTVNGVDLPAPSDYIGTEATLVDSARNVKGVVVGSVIRDSVAKVEMTWKFISASDWATILQLFNPNYGGNFYNSVEFYNQLLNDWDTRNMYVGDRTTAGAYLRDPNTGYITGYKNARLALIEV